MEIVTHQENIRRAANKITHCPNGHPYTEKNTIRYASENFAPRCKICRAEQAKHRKRWREAKYHGSAKGELNTHSKITEEDVRFIRNSSLKYKELGEMFQMSINSIYWIKNGITWKHLP